MYAFLPGQNHAQHKHKYMSSTFSVITPPTIMGSVAPYNGFTDLTTYIQENYLEEWLDIFRKWFHLHKS